MMTRQKMIFLKLTFREFLLAYTACFCNKYIVVISGLVKFSIF